MTTNEARNKFRDVVDTVQTGEADVVVERYGKPLVAVISYKDYQAMEEILEELRAVRHAEKAYEAWKKDPSRGKPYEEFREELLKEDLLDE